MGVSKATADSSAALRNDKKKSERQQEVRSVIEGVITWVTGGVELKSGGANGGCGAGHGAAESYSDGHY
jgi:hypothetical protein